MRKLSLSTMLVTFSLGIVGAAVLGVGIGGISLLRRLADDRAQAQVLWASEGAVEAVGRTAERLVMGVQLLSERPTLHRLMAAGDADAVRAYLADYQRRAGFSNCAAGMEGDWVSVGTEPMPWPQITDDDAPTGSWRIHRPTPGGALVMSAVATATDHPGLHVVAVRELDETYAERTGGKVGLPVTILAAEDVDHEGLDPRGMMHRRSLEEGSASVARVGSPVSFRAATTLRDPSGRVVGIVEAMLPAADVDAPLARLMRTLIGLAAAVGLVMILVSLWVARGIAGPIENLTHAAVRMGRGDLSSPMPRAPGRETGTLGDAMEEMRERVLRLTRELERRKAEAEAVLTGIVEGVYSVDRERRICYLNPQAAAILGITPEEAVGRFCGDVLRPRDAAGERPCERSCPILHARFRGSACATEHVRREDGTWRPVVITSAPPATGTDAGEPGPLQFQVLRDETEQEASRRLRDAVLANISHEFRTPLSAQLASLEMLREKLPDMATPDVSDLVSSIERGTLRLTQLIENLLESTRIEAGRDSLRRIEVQLDRVVEEAVEFVSPLIQQRHQTLELDLPYPLPVIQGDPQRLVQVFVNLLANANKFAPPDSPIRVGGRVGRETIDLWVEDQGPGLPDGADGVIFGRFVRALGTEPEAGGMGLGLYIVKSIVARHGGRLEARNRAPGTRMCVMLPRKP